MLKAAAWALTITAVSAQPPFEVASIKVSKLADEGRWHEQIDTTPASLTMREVSLASCILWAYDIAFPQLVIPNLSERFDIQAKAEAPVGVNELRMMLRTLLADRFKLTIHRDSKVVSGYALVVARQGAKVHASDGPAGTIRLFKGIVEAEHASMQQLANILYASVRKPVVDQTNLSGLFSFTFDFTNLASAPGAEIPDIPTLISERLQSQLGLKLEPRKATVETFIVDHVEKLPTEN